MFFAATGIAFSQATNSPGPSGAAPGEDPSAPVKMEISIRKPDSADLPVIPPEPPQERPIESFKAALSKVEAQLAEVQSSLSTAQAPEMVRKTLESTLGRELAGTGAVIYRDNEFVVIRVPEAAFQSGSGSAPGNLKNILAPIAKAALKTVSQFDLMVEGHSDDKPVKKNGKFENNWQVGYARAETVAALLQKMTLRTDSIAIATRANNLPITNNGSDAENRRVEFVFMPKRSLPPASRTAPLPVSGSTTSASTANRPPNPNAFPPPKETAQKPQQKPLPAKATPAPSKKEKAATTPIASQPAQPPATTPVQEPAKTVPSIMATQEPRQQLKKVPTSLDPEGDAIFNDQKPKRDNTPTIIPLSAEEFQDAVKNGKFR